MQVGQDTIAAEYEHVSLALGQFAETNTLRPFAEGKFRMLH